MHWLKGKRPSVPNDWTTRVEDTERAIAARLGRRTKLLSEEDEKALFVDHWKQAKVPYAKAQHAKCGYCEAKIGADPKGGDVEHYRPKGRVDELLEHGEEMAGINLRDPKKPRRTQPIGLGYWWLAYRWDNYLLACGTCNEKWKGCLFPIAGGRTTGPSRKGWGSEQALLLDPYGSYDPAEHLTFDEFGQIAPYGKSPHGHATIETCHLARETLREHRQHLASDACLWIDQIVAVETTPAGVQRVDALTKAREAVRMLRRSGAEERQFCGMIRVLVWRRLAVAWNDFDEGILPSS